MSARQLYTAGYRDLVSVVPPKGALAPTTGLKAESRGKVPGKRRLDGKWVGYPWLQQEAATESDVATWERWGANIGLRGDSFPGVDLDIDHPQLAQVVQKVAQEVLGPAPVRTSTGSRRLLCYRTASPLGRSRAQIVFAGQEHVVEILSKGRQYLVSGGHPSGADYGWDGSALWEWPPEELTEITQEKVEAFFARLAELLDGRAEVHASTVEATEAADVPQESLTAPSPEALRDLVADIPNHFPDRDSYIEFGCAIKAAGGDEALPVFQEWASRWEGGVNEPETVEADWSRMHPPFRVGWTYLVEHAEEHGYSSAQEEFEADPDAAPWDPPSPQVRLPSGVIQYTDTWVAERIAEAVRDRVRYVPLSGAWHVWNGHAWAKDPRNEAEYLVRRGLVALSQEVRKQAQVHPDEKERKRLHRMALDLQSRSALTKTIPELQAHPLITLTPDQFDADPWLLNTPGGVVDLRTGRLRPANPAELHSLSTAVTPSFDRKPARWLEYLEEATGGDGEFQRYLQKQIGYSLTGSTQEQTLCFIHGTGGTGKSVFVQTVGGLFGSYHQSSPADTFARSRGDRHPTDLAKLAGSRLVTAVETHEGRAWDTQRIKSITGGDVVSARFMRQDFFDFTPTFKILIVGNHEPQIDGVDEAMMRRLRVIPFNRKPQEIDRLLSDKLEVEWPAILAWAIEGCQLWLHEGLEPAEAVKVRTERYRQEEDPVGAFLEECCVFGPDHSIPRQDLYRVWAQWCHSQGEDAGTLKQMKRRFAHAEDAHNFHDAKLSEPDGSRPRGYVGIRVKDDTQWP